MNIANIGVIGAGQMGRGIAQVAAQAGLGVFLLDAKAELAEAGVATLRKTLDRLVEKGKLDAGVRDEAMARITPCAAFGALRECDFVVEAAPENEDLKLRIFAEASASTRRDVILASNTSSISITKLASVTSRPDMVIGMHFMNPVPLMKLVEIIRALPTSDATVATTVALAEKLGKATVESRDIPGFIVNRVLIPFINEACFALYEGLGSVTDIDAGVRMGLNHPMGPLELADLIGLDTVLAIAEVLHRELGDSKYRPCPLLRQQVAAGWLGKKTGRGFYRYDERGAKL